MEINFKKVHTGKDLAISTIVLLAGAGLFFVNRGLGICIAVCGLLMLLFYKCGYKNKQGNDGGSVRLDVFFNKSENVAEKLISLL
ncbi:MAG: hypothetical protein MJZ17_00155 [Bacteroidales bacterium]|nr:hypothetical protein [Bacteroidales bacterium]